MSFLSRLFRRNPKPLPMQPNNVLIISSSAKELDQVLDILVKKYHYSLNSDIIRLDNGDFAQVVKR